MHNFPEANQLVNVRDLAELNNALRKSANAGYQSPAGTSGGDTGSLSPLIPQSIENTLASATYTMKELALWPAMPKVNATNTVHEYAVINDHGLDLEPFIAEGSAGQTNRSSYERKSVRVKYLAERREVTDVGSLVGLLGNNANAIAQETERGTLRLLGKLERSLWHANESVNPLAFDGIIKQIESHDSGANTFDLAGKSPTPRLLQEVLSELQSAPRYGRPDCIYVEPRIHAELIKFAVQFGRHDQLSIRSLGAGQGLSYGVQDLHIMSPYGAVPVKSAPFLFDSYKAPSTASSTDAPNAPASVTEIVEDDASSKFVANDNGTYYYKIVSVNNSGYSAPLTSAQVTIDTTANPLDNKVTLQIPQTAGAVFFKIYRSEKNGSADTCSFIGEIKQASQGTTDFVDLNARRPNTSKIVFVQHDPQVMEFVRLLDFFRRPLAEVATSKPFLLMLFGSPVVKVPSKCWVLQNAGVTATSSMLDTIV
jgi:hypothetical protein